MLSDREAAQLADIQEDIDSWSATKRTKWLRDWKKKGPTVGLKDTLIRIMLIGNVSALEGRKILVDALATSQLSASAIIEHSGRVELPAAIFRPTEH